MSSADNDCSTSPPQLTSFWEEMDAVFDGPTDEMPDIFPVNVHDDPPFVGFDFNPKFDHLSDLCGADFQELDVAGYNSDSGPRCTLDSVETCQSPDHIGVIEMMESSEPQHRKFARTSCSGFDKDVEMRHSSPGKLRCKRSLPVDDKTDFECFGDEDVVFNFNSPQRRHGYNSVSGPTSGESCRQKFRNQSHSLLSNAVEVHRTSPGKFHYIRSRQKLSGVWEMQLNQNASEYVAADDTDIGYKSPSQKQGSSDDDILFNFNSPQRQRGIIFPPDAEKSKGNGADT